MEKCADLEPKYQKLAAEYSKVRSQAVVLKKAVIDEQAKNSELKDSVKKYEQQSRKQDQEMESLKFRNEQLTKRICFLQSELQAGCDSRKHKNKISCNVTDASSSVLDELQKKILENAQLVSRMADKDYELSDHKEKIEWLEGKVASLQRILADFEERYKGDTVHLENQKFQLNKSRSDAIHPLKHQEKFSENHGESTTEVTYWQEEVARWKGECEVLRSKPDSNDELTEYYESHISDLLNFKQLAHSETKSLWAENLAISSRLEQLLLENKHLENCLTKSNEELVTTSENYKAQLDAMTEHLAAQNEKITKQCDEIQLLRHKLLQKK